MILAEPLIEPTDLTYEDYMSEGEFYRRYDIIDGERVFTTNPTIWRQEISLSIAGLFRVYQRTSGAGRTIIAPCDILITREPLRTRQPDVLFISRERFGPRKRSDASALSPAPEVVVEVLSPSERRGARMSKIEDYCMVDVVECWIVSPEAETVEVLRLSRDGVETVRTHNHDETIVSIAFPDLSVRVADIFDSEE
ncbi:MAG: Uma2 family endonuclease [Capsulimonadaceae bacterium]